MRRLLFLVAVIVAADTIFYAAMTPLLPGFADEYGLSKAGAGVLVAAYAAGALIGAIPAGAVAARLGARRAVLGGLLLMSAASLAFALAGDEWTLGLSRLLQGFGSVFSWAGGLTWLVASTPRERRGEMLGTAMGAAVFGALLGPVLGSIAGVAGTRPTFVATSLLGLALAAWAASTPGPPRERESAAALRPALREPRLLAGLWLVVLPAILFGALLVLVPLRLDAFGWGAIAIGAVFLVTTAIEVVLNPLLGRYSDRVGRLVPVRAALAGSIAVSVALAWAASPAVVVALTLAAGVAYGGFYTPALAIISESAEALGLAQALAFAVMNACWAAGAITGPALAGALAEWTGDAGPYLVSAALCAATLVATRPRLIARAAAARAQS